MSDSEHRPAGKQQPARWVIKLQAFLDVRQPRIIWLTWVTMPQPHTQKREEAGERVLLKIPVQWIAAREEMQ